MLTTDQPGATLNNGLPSSGPRYRQPPPSVRQAAERKLQERLTEIQTTGRRPARPRPQRDPADAYLPSEEEIAAQCAQFRSLRLAELV